MRYQQKKKKASKILGWLLNFCSFVDDNQPGWIKELNCNL